MVWVSILVCVSTKLRGIRDKENSMGDRVAFCTSCQPNRPQNRSTDPLVPPIPSSNHIVVHNKGATGEDNNSIFATLRTANLDEVGSGSIPIQHQKYKQISPPRTCLPPIPIHKNRNQLLPALRCPLPQSDPTFRILLDADNELQITYSFTPASRGGGYDILCNHSGGFVSRKSCVVLLVCVTVLVPWMLASPFEVESDTHSPCPQ